MKLTKPYPKGPLGPNPANTAGVGGYEAEPHHEAVHAVSRARRVAALKKALAWARLKGDTARAEQLQKEIDNGQ